MIKIILLVIALMALTGCQSTGLRLANSANDPQFYDVQRDVAYGTKPWQTLDIYTPTRVKDPYPVVVFYYGGSWTGGSKNYYGFIANRLIKSGFAVIIPDYVKYPEAMYPAFVEDAARVSHWLDQHVDAIGVNRNAIHIMGHSAGAHIAAMLIADAQFLDVYGLTPDFYASFVGIAGPYSFTPSSRRYRRIFGPEEDDYKMQVDSFIDGDEPPMLLLQGGLDWLVTQSNMNKLSAAINAKGGKVKTVTYCTLGHLSIIASLSESMPFGDRLTDEVVTFLEQNSHE